MLKVSSHEVIPRAAKVPSTSEPQRHNQLQVNVSSAGQFHAFDLARQLFMHGLLNRLFTGYPKRLVSGIPFDKIQSYQLSYAPYASLRMLGLDGIADRLSSGVNDVYDQRVADRLDRCDIFHFISSFGLRSSRTARKKYGSYIVCDRGSSHIAFQDRILREEYAEWGFNFGGISRAAMERELAEYDECDALLVPSSFAFETFIKNGTPREKIHRLPYGVDLSFFKRTAKEDDIFRVLYVGQMSLRKGLPYLLEAIAPLDLRKFEVWLVGPAHREARPFLKRYRGRFRYFGVVPRRELPWYYSQASVFVIASIEEGLALVQAQAMACGVPIIATAHTGGADILTHGTQGYIVPIRDPEAIRAKILFLYDHPEVRERMAAAALTHATELGTWDEYGRRIVDFYQIQRRWKA